MQEVLNFEYDRTKGDHKVFVREAPRISEPRALPVVSPEKFSTPSRSAFMQTFWIRLSLYACQSCPISDTLA